MDGRSDRGTEFITASSEARGPIKYLNKKGMKRLKDLQRSKLDGFALFKHLMAKDPDICGYTYFFRTPASVSS